MHHAYQKSLEKNIIKYSWYKVFTKRIYLPVITIQLVNVGMVTLEELALMVIISSLVYATLQMPAGYLADKIGNRKSIILGAAISLPSPLFYAFMPDFWGGLVAAILFFGGWAFQSGAIESFMHSSLGALGREKEYSKVMGRAQTYSLLGNIVLIASVPATYGIHPTIPFVIGFFSQLAILLLTISFIHPPIDTSAGQHKSPLNAVRSIVNAQNVLLFIFAGFLSGVVQKGGEFRELVFQDIGIAVALFGIIAAISSIVGAIMGWYIHILDRLKPLSFYLFDLSLVAGCFVMIGFTTNPVVIVSAFTIFAAYYRVRMIIFQSKMLTDIKHAYKATLVSALNLFTLLGDIFAIALLTQLVTGNGYLTGHLLFGLTVFVVGAILWVLMLMEQRHRIRIASA